MKRDADFYWDVIILGGGLSGLSAAYELSNSGVSVKIIEARNRLGGRVFTDRSSKAGESSNGRSSLPIEYGAEYIHGKLKSTFEIVKKANLHPEKIPNKGLSVRDGKFVPPDEIFEAVNEMMSTKMKAVDQDLSFQEFMNKFGAEFKSEPMKKRAYSFIEGFNAADASKISVRALIASEENPDTERQGDDEEGWVNFQIAEGYDSITDWYRHNLGTNCEISLENPVKKISWKPGHVDVHCQQGSFRAKKTLITLPIGVWKADPKSASYVEFSPDLEAKRHALKFIEMGDVVKLIFKFKTSFWKEAEVKGTDLKDTKFFFMEDAPWFRTFWTAQPFKDPLLTAWCGGPRASQLDRMSQAELSDIALQSVALLFDRSQEFLKSQIEDCYFHSWTQDPYSLGAYSYILKDGLEHQKSFSEPVSETLYFAGEAIPPSGELGIVNGAIASGKKAAEAILG